MRRYVGEDVVYAAPATRGDFYFLSNKELPAGEDGDAEGYLVNHKGSELTRDGFAKGHIKWSPTHVFTNAYRESPFRFEFGAAIEALKDGHRVTRTGWNGKGMYLYYVPAQSYPTQTEAARAKFGDSVPYAAYLALVTTQGNVATWTPSITDIFATDWVIYED